MNNCPPDVREELTVIGKRNVRTREWLQGCLDRELRELPLRKENVTVYQGRCQVLQEILALINSAQPNQQPNTHTDRSV